MLVADFDSALDCAVDIALFVAAGAVATEKAAVVADNSIVVAADQKVFAVWAAETAASVNSPGTGQGYQEWSHPQGKACSDWQ